ncbi:type II toxin-antitoxin system VapB family antitoxin [Olivibacter sitiensis]|uniref:type II toxin-antitoxin system VapB family antitoxin n=1 Tax=Olivibacter sitiensis TaxID=376470 RepID=UPI001FDF249A|nr:type II toxin-antitoxin system VapB family antitoxin [Olivibacter sitiensis]
MMRTNIELDDQLVKQALQISNLKTKKDVVHEALKQYVASLKRKKLLALRDKGTWEGDLEQMRSL